jgi:hypothetical protein
MNSVTVDNGNPSKRHPINTGKLAAAHITQQATGAGVTPHDTFTSTCIVGALQPSSRAVDC